MEKTYEFVAQIDIEGLHFAIPVSLKSDSWVSAYHKVLNAFPKAMKALSEGQEIDFLHSETPDYDD